MMDSQKKDHWDHVYQTKRADQVSWTQQKPQSLIDFITDFKLPISAKIIDIGGGDSGLSEFMLEAGFTDITVLDISQRALDKAKNRLGDQADKIKWVVSDITEFSPTESYDLWYDRATFHFLTQDDQINKYKAICKNAVKGFMLMGTFSQNGPSQCSGLEIKQYSDTTLPQLFSSDFQRIKCIRENHLTPFNTTQEFVFCSFKKLKQTTTNS